MTYKYLETWPQSGIPGTQLMIVKICSQVKWKEQQHVGVWIAMSTARAHVFGDLQVHPLKSQQFQPRFNCARQPWRYFGVPARVARRAALQCASSAIVRVDPDYEPSWSNPAGKWLFSMASPDRYLRTQVLVGGLHNPVLQRRHSPPAAAARCLGERASVLLERRRYWWTSCGPSDS